MIVGIFEIYSSQPGAQARVRTWRELVTPYATMVLFIYTEDKDKCRQQCLTARASSILSNQYTVLLLHDKLLDCADDGETLLVR